MVEPSQGLDTEREQEASGRAFWFGQLGDSGAVHSEKVLDSAAIPHIPCPACQYCVKGCPMEIAIPGIFKAMNSYLIYNNLPGARGNYGFETRLGGVASNCIACRQCEEVCPQHIAIVDELARAAEILEKK